MQYVDVEFNISCQLTFPSATQKPPSPKSSKKGRRSSEGPKLRDFEAKTASETNRFFGFSFSWGFCFSWWCFRCWKFHCSCCCSWCSCCCFNCFRCSFSHVTCNFSCSRLLKRQNPTSKWPERSLLHVPGRTGFAQIPQILMDVSLSHELFRGLWEYFIPCTIKTHHCWSFQSDYHHLGYTIRPTHSFTTRWIPPFLGR